MESKEKVYAVKVDGQSVPTWQMFWEQMMAQGCRIDKAKRIARVAVVIALMSLLVAVIAVVRCN